MVSTVWGRSDEKRNPLNLGLPICYDQSTHGYTAISEAILMKQLQLATALTLLVVPLLVPTNGLARTWHVTPGGTGEAPTIQAGIDSAAAADTVLLSDDVFTGDGNRDIDFKGKAITVRSESGDPTLCIIDCEGTSGDHHWGFKFTTDEGSTSVLEGVLR